MKKLLTLALGLSGFAGFSQNLAVDSIEINTLKAHIYADGGVWEIQTWDDSTYKPLVFAQNLWLAGYDINNDLHTAVQTHRTVGTADFRPGPISNDPNATTKYNKVYRVNLQTLTDFKNGVTQGIPQEIADWPAHGNTAMGEAANLAPFVDVNSNGIYEPSQGDYPKIKGDEAIYVIFNDANGRTTGKPIGVEIHAMYYAYLTGGIEDSIIYMDYKIFNRSGNHYANCFLSSFADFDLGNHLDDLVGTNISSDAVFCYNADAYDEGPNGFGQNLASCGFRLIDGPPADYFDAIDNDKDGCIDGVRDANGFCQAEDPNTGINEHWKLSGSMVYDGQVGAIQGSPNTPADYYSYMNSMWKDSTNLIIESPSGFMNTGNGDGYVAGGLGTATRFVYPGDTYDTTGGYEPSAPIIPGWFNAPNITMDKMTLSTSGSFFSMGPNESFEIKMAFVWDRRPFSGSFGGINKKIDDLDELYANQPVRTVGLNAYKATSHYQLSFNTASAEWTITNSEHKNLDFALYTTTGQLMKIFSVESNSKITIPTQGFAQGVYILVETKTGQTHKITK